MPVKDGASEKMIYNLAETLKKMEQDVMYAREAGVEEGYEKGIQKGKIEVARNLLAKNTAFDLIAEATGLSVEEIKALQAESNDKTH
jgi:predicted transposase/invertase (TIGR01784 family)